MTNALALCLIFTLFCCSNLSSARQVPKECSKGPDVWCQSLKQAAECGAVGHCISSVWAHEEKPIKTNDVAIKFVALFKELKDIKELINEEYLGLRLKAACRSLAPAAARLCKQNTVGFDTYLSHVLGSKTSPQTMCRVVGMCNNEKLYKILENSASDTLDEQDYTFKHYYYPVSDGDDSIPSAQDETMKRKINTSSDIDVFFEHPKPKKRKTVSSTVGQGSKGGGVSYISTNRDDVTNSTHLIKIEIYDMKKLSKITDASEHWKHADVRVKYYVNKIEKNKHLETAKDLVFRITKEIAETDECKKYHFNTKL